MTSKANFLSGNYQYTLLASCTNVANIIAALNTLLVTNGNWIDTGGGGTGPFKSPVNANDGTYMLVTLTAVSATQLRWVCSDSGARQINYPVPPTSSCQDIDAGGTNIYITTSDDLILVDSARATGEVFWVCRLNVYPLTAGIYHTSFACATGPRDSSNGIANNTLSCWHYLDTGGDYTMGAGYNDVLFNPFNITSYLVSVAGDYITVPYEVCNSITKVLLGRVPHCVLCTSPLAKGNTFNVPLGDGTNGVFRVTTLPSTNGRLLAVRVG